MAEQKLECSCLALLLRGKYCREWLGGFGVLEHLSHAVDTGCLEFQSHFSPYSREQGRNVPRKGLCFNFWCEVCVASHPSPSFCMCLCTHTCTLLFLGCLCAFSSSYNTGKSFTAPQSVLQHGIKLQHSCLGCLVPSFDHGVQSVLQGCPQPPVTQHCPRLGDMGLVHANVIAPRDICLIPQ